MGIILAVGNRTEPGRLGDHLAGSAEALSHLRRLGMRAVTLRPMVGTDVGTIMTMINYENNADFAASWGRLAGDAEWQGFAARTAQGGASVQVESSLFADIDPGFQPSADRPMGVVMTTQWRAKPGRLMDFMGNVMTSVPHIVRMGGTARVMQSVIGAYPMTVIVGTTFTDMDAYGAYSDTLATDQQWAEFWAGAMTDPTADLVRTSLMVNISAA